MEVSRENRSQKNMENKPIKSYRDLRIYQNLYEVMILVLTKIVPKLPREEKYDLGDQCAEPVRLGQH